MSQEQHTLPHRGLLQSSTKGFSALLARVRTHVVSGNGDRDSDCQIPLPHRLAIIYLMLPVAIWLVGWHHWWFGVPAAALLAFALWRSIGPIRFEFGGKAFSRTCRKALRPTTLFLLFAAFAWVIATAAGGVFDLQNGDWVKHRAVFLDLTRGSWPVSYPFWLSDLAAFFPSGEDPEPFYLRYYLGYYIVPGLLGNWFGEAALNWAVPLYTWMGVALMLHMFARGFRGYRVVAATTIFVFFGGMDIAMHLLFEGWNWFHPNVSWNG